MLLFIQFISNRLRDCQTRGHRSRTAIRNAENTFQKYNSKNIIWHIWQNRLRRGFYAMWHVSRAQKTLSIYLSVYPFQWSVNENMYSIRSNFFSRNPFKTTHIELQEKLIEKESLTDEKSETLPSGADVFFYRTMCPSGIIFDLTDFPHVKVQLTSVKMNELQDLIKPAEVWKTISYAAWIFPRISEIFKIFCLVHCQISVYKYL